MRNFNNKDMAKLSHNCRSLYLFHLTTILFCFLFCDPNLSGPEVPQVGYVNENKRYANKFHSGMDSHFSSPKSCFSFSVKLEILDRILDNFELESSYSFLTREASRKIQTLHYSNINFSLI